jgi:hypothetical protein
MAENIRWYCVCGARPRGPFCNKCDGSKLTHQVRHDQQHDDGKPKSTDAILKKLHEKSLASPGHQSLNELHQVRTLGEGMLRPDDIPRCARYYCAECSLFLASDMSALNWDHKQVHAIHVRAHLIKMEVERRYLSQHPDNWIGKEFNKLWDNGEILTDAERTELGALFDRVRAIMDAVDAEHEKGPWPS